MPRTSTWTGDAEKELIMALWRSASSGPVRPDWTKAGAIMESRGFGFTLEAMRSRWSKKLMKELYSLDEPGTAAAKASPGRKRKRVVDDEDENEDAAAPSTPKKPITTGLQTPDNKKAKASKSGGAMTIKQEAVDVPVGSGHDQQQEELSPEPSPTARARVRRSNPGRSAAKAQSYKEWSGEDSAIDGSVNDESFGDDSDGVA